MTTKDKQEYKYNAFICHSHKDEKWGKWLQHGIENYKIPKAIIGRDTIYGKIPKKITKLFRAIEVNQNSVEISDDIINALNEANHLIVVCSPNSATSQWVNELVKIFKKFGKQNLILCLIVDGEPNAESKPELSLQECFPSALKVKADKDGNLTDIPAEPLAADAREIKDGKFNSKLKIISGLLGIGFDELFQRDEKRNKRKLITISLLAFVFFPIAILSVLETINIITWNNYIDIITPKHRNLIPEYTVWLNSTNISKNVKLPKRIVDKNSAEKYYSEYNLHFHLIATGSFSFDELRIGATYKSVIPGNESDKNNLLYEPFDYDSDVKLKNIKGWSQSQEMGMVNDYTIKRDSIKYGKYNSLGNRVYSSNAYTTSKTTFSLVNTLSRASDMKIWDIWGMISPEDELIDAINKIKDNNNEIFYSFFMRPEGLLNQGAHNGFFYLSFPTQLSNIGYCIGKSTLRESNYGSKKNYFKNDIYKYNQVPGEIKPYASNTISDYPMDIGKSYFFIIRIKLIADDVQ